MGLGLSARQKNPNKTPGFFNDSSKAFRNFASVRGEPATDANFPESPLKLSNMAGIDEQLEALNTRFYDAEDDLSEEIIAELTALHKQALQAGGEDAEEFFRNAPHVAGGAYIPYLFWIELAQFRRGEESRERLFFLLESFVNGDFEEAIRQRMKPLIVIYYLHERQFEIDKLNTTIVSKAHPQVQEFFQHLNEFVETNQTATRAYEEKFNLLMDYFPNFELFELPVQDLEEQLSSTE